VAICSWIPQKKIEGMKIVEDKQWVYYMIETTPSTTKQTKACPLSTQEI
jgi:hypothetical protein